MLSLVGACRADGRREGSFRPVRVVEGGGMAGGVVARVVEGKDISSTGGHLLAWDL